MPNKEDSLPKVVINWDDMANAKLSLKYWKIKVVKKIIFRKLIKILVIVYYMSEVWKGVIV